MVDLGDAGKLKDFGCYGKIVSVNRIFINLRKVKEFWNELNKILMKLKKENLTNLWWLNET